MPEEILPTGSRPSQIQGRRLAWGLPPLSTNLILRRRLFPKLDAVAHGGMALVEGPAGSGKSSLVSGWARYADPGEILWLSLSPDDNRDPDLWSHARSEFARFVGDPPPDDHPIVFVVDNIEVLTEPALSAGLASLVESMAGRIGLVMIGRHAARLPLHKLSLRSSVSELGPEELACTEDETAEFLSTWRSETVPDEWVRTVAERTEGWAGGIRLASLTMAEFGPTYDVSHSLRTDRGLISDFFEKEIFEQQTASVRDFLCKTSVLEVLEQDVCDHVSGRHDSLHVLEGLARRNMFVRRLPGADQFRYHGLFKDFLRHQLALLGHDAEREARIAAAHFLDQKGDTRAATDQMRAAGALDELFAIALRNTLTVVEAGHAGAGDLMLPAGIPDSYFERSPLRIYPLCVSYLAQLELDRASRWIRRMELTAEAEGEAAPAINARCEILWAAYDLARMDSEGMLHHLEAGAGLSDQARSAEFYRSLRNGHQWVRELDTAMGSLLPMIEAQGELWRGRPGRAGQIMSDAYGADRSVTNPTLASVFAQVLAAEGQIRRAEDMAATALARADQDGLSSSSGTVGLRMVLAGVLYEHDDLVGAGDQLLRADRVCRAAGQDRWRVGIECQMARLDLARGRPTEALRRLDGLRSAELLRSNVPLQMLAHEVEVRCRLALGDLLGAEDLLIDTDQVSPSPELLARFHLATGRPDRAAAEVGRSGFTARGRPSIERLLLQTRVFLQAGNRRAAEHALQRAVNLSRGDGFVRVFLDEPKQISDLLASVSAGGADAFVQSILDRVPVTRPQAGRPQPYILEPLTERERELLGYLPCHLSQSEIATRMFISANTVKTHMKGLYRKLGASSRSEAVDIARDSGLLSPTIGV